MTGGRRFVRIRDGDRFEIRCDACGEWWPAALEHWDRVRGLSHCRPCWRQYVALKQRGYEADEARRDVARTKDRLRYALNRPARLAANRAWKEAHREHIAAYNKAYRARHKAELAAKQRAYYAESPEIARRLKQLAYQNETPIQRERRRERDRERYARRAAA